MHVCLWIYICREVNKCRFLFVMWCKWYHKQSLYFVWKTWTTWKKLVNFFHSWNLNFFFEVWPKSQESLKRLEKSGKFTKFNKYNVFTFVNIMSLLLQCVNFQVSTVYSFVDPSNLVWKGSGFIIWTAAPG